MKQSLWVALALLCVTCGAALAANPFRNIDDTPWASRCDGPQGALIIADDSAVPRAGYAFAVSAAARADAADLERAGRTVDLLKRLGLASPRSRAAFPRVAVHTVGGRMALPELARAAAARAAASGATRRPVGGRARALGDPANQLRFVFEGWPTGDESALRTYLNTAYPVARFIYGPPAFDLTVKIIRDPTIRDIQGGIYDVTTNEIRMPGLTGNFPEDSLILMMLVLHAFHDDLMLFYDAWEQGMAGAAAVAVQTSPGVSPSYNPYDPGPFYCLSVYECENQPALANPTFYPASGFTGMLVWRIAMARAAWLKCYIENPRFFAGFNERYYAAFEEGLQGDVPALKELCEAALPFVEGMRFRDWFERQYVLDTSTRIGLKLYTWNVPLEEAVALIVEHYFTGGGGDESPRGGEARTNYWSFDFSISLFAEEGNVIQIPGSGASAGEGFLVPAFYNIGGGQRITVQMDLAGLRAFYPYPYLQRGFRPGQNTLYGAPIGATSGTLDVVGGKGISGLAVTRGVFGAVASTGALSPMQLVVTFTNAAGQKTVRTVNVGWDSYCLFMPSGSQRTVTNRWEVGRNGLHLISLPVWPLESDASAILGIAPENLLLARWDPSLPPQGAYRVWPSVEPFAPGRGFWIRLFAPLDLAVTGIEPVASADAPIELKLGWNMIGSPRLSGMPLSALKVSVGEGPAMTLTEAADAGIIQRSIFGYSQTEGYVLAEMLQPFVGYWIRCLSPGGARLLVPPSSAAATQASEAQGVSGAQSASGAEGWRVALVAECGSSRSTAIIGCAPGASEGVDARYDALAPPDLEPAVSCRLALEGVAGYLADIRPTGRESYSWELEVRPDGSGGPLRLRWPDLCALPRGMTATLVDEAARRRQYMRTTAYYEVPGGSDDTPRRLRIELSSAPQAQLAVTGLAHQATDRSVELAYTLSCDAAVTARVLNIAGRPVRMLVSDRAQAAGRNAVQWNLRDDGASLVPNGLYLVRLEARSETGQRVSALQTVQVVRR